MNFAKLDLEFQVIYFLQLLAFSHFLKLNEIACSESESDWPAHIKTVITSRKIQQLNTGNSSH